MDSVKSQIEQWLQPVLAEKDFFLVDVKVLLGKKIEVYVDSDEGIHIDDCATISRFLEKKLDGSGIVPENYVLDVSSPGMSNPLKVPRQYKRRIGRILEIVKTDGTQLEAELLSANEQQIELQPVAKAPSKKKNAPAVEAPAKIILPYSDIKRALIQFKF